jgi:hypothetical protein
MIVYLAIVATVAAIASVGRLVIALLDYKKSWPEPNGSTSTGRVDLLQIHPDGSWSTPAGWRNR